MMNKDIKTLLCAASVALLATACSNDETEYVDITRPIDLQLAPAAPAAGTKAGIDAATFDANDVVGLYWAWTEGTVTGDVPITASIVKNTTWGNGSISGELLYWQNTTDVHTLYAYYPYTAQVADNAYALPVSIKADQNSATAAADYEATDVLWGKLSSTARSSLSLSLGHRLSLLTVTLQKGDGYATDEALPAIASVEISNGTDGFRLEGTLNLADGSVTAGTGGTTASALTAYSYGGTYRAIVLPGETIVPTIRITTEDGTTYTYTYSSTETPSIQTASNQVYAFTLDLNKGSLTLANGTDGLSISAWGTSTSITGDAGMDIPASATAGN